ncbi:DUF2164 domain-containing protein [Alteromonas sp. KUL49]|uniref:DUF2164 domain-containing protein n=1 Tax=Alteromonas sp. KUL49 TaxID=2480798 RepID=UPI00102EFF15|nr:DUF2164 domain-containing protein [Alteromonas sp. KUL49]TAP40673.1 DUF2164 domain-containing protein [Alteromonas sp. KUL49]GEA10840.1 hypothetical protein KUL49_12150 [Alteromonas sp. KUL49]
MSEITLSDDIKSTLVNKLQDYFTEELDQELGQFDGEFLLDFIAKNMGAYFYNQGLYDARAVFESRIAAIDEDIYGIEKPVV